jgi:hypothetical protein
MTPNWAAKDTARSPLANTGGSGSLARAERASARIVRLALTGRSSVNPRRYAGNACSASEHAEARSARAIALPNPGFADQPSAAGKHRGRSAARPLTSSSSSRPIETQPHASTPTRSTPHAPLTRTSPSAPASIIASGHHSHACMARSRSASSYAGSPTYASAANHIGEAASPLRELESLPVSWNPGQHPSADPHRIGANPVDSGGVKHRVARYGDQATSQPD